MGKKIIVSFYLKPKGSWRVSIDDKNMLLVHYLFVSFVSISVFYLRGWLRLSIVALLGRLLNSLKNRYKSLFSLSFSPGQELNLLQ